MALLEPMITPRILPDLRQLKTAEPTVEYFDIQTGEFQKIRLSERKIKYGRAHPSAGTFGTAQTATPSPKVQITPESEKAALTSLEEAELKLHLRGPRQNRWGGQRNTRLKTLKGKFGKANEGRKLTREEIDKWMKKNDFFEPVITPAKLKCAYQHWPSIIGTEWTHGVCLHFPAWLAEAKAENQDAVCQRLKSMKRYLIGLDRKAFGSAAYRKHQTRIPRCVVEEWNDSVGFHVHMLMMFPPNIDPAAFIPHMEQNWHRKWWNYSNAAFRKHSFWAEEITGGHEPYISKHIGLESIALLYGDCTHFP